MPGKKIAIIGAGPGGLTAAMILTHRGYQVTVYEKEAVVGGRNAAIKLGPYTFDTGPTFLMMTFILREVFQMAGTTLEEHCRVVPLEPMYRLCFEGKTVEPTSDHEKMRAHIAQLFPGNEAGYERFLRTEALRYQKMYPCLQKSYSDLGSLLSPPLIKAIPHLSLSKTLYSNLASYFDNELLRISFTFQAKYLGMSPWECPAAFTIIPYVEHKYGVDHIMGGLSVISDAMAHVAQAKGAQIHLSTPVKRILAHDQIARGVELSTGEKVEYDAVVINADFGHAMKTLFEPGVIKKYTPENLEKKKLSCSTFMIYLGLDKLYDEPHHCILFAKQYRENITRIASGAPLNDDVSIYVRNASITDPSLAPQGHSALYILVPVPNNRSRIAWTDDVVRSFRDQVLDTIIARTSMKDLREHIVVERVITPTEWEHSYGVYRGATFNLGHNISQMLYFRPHNRFEEVGNCYLVGGGTHPGSGLPTIYESARISSKLIDEDFGRS